MSREIKFRAWDKRKNRFGYFNLGPRRVNWPSPKWLCQELVKEIDGDTGGVYFPDIEGFQEYTGLHDKKGKELFEGDRVQYKVRNQIKTGIIAWGKVGFWIVGDLYKLYDVNHWQIEVIGNIYENGNLLSGDK